LIVREFISISFCDDYHLEFTLGNPNKLDKII